MCVTDGTGDVMVGRKYGGMNLPHLHTENLTTQQEFFTTQQHFPQHTKTSQHNINLSQHNTKLSQHNKNLAQHNSFPTGHNTTEVELPVPILNQTLFVDISCRNYL